MLKGVALDDGIAGFDSVVPQGGEGRNLWFTVTLHEGRNREVRRIWESQGIQVNRLVRNSFGPVRMARRLKKAQCEELDEKQIKSLYAAVKMRSPMEKASHLADEAPARDKSYRPRKKSKRLTKKSRPKKRA
jgi:23S rRNA pseudouridine2605 synthase